MHNSHLLQSLHRRRGLRRTKLMTFPFFFLAKNRKQKKGNRWKFRAFCPRTPERGKEKGQVSGRSSFLYSLLPRTDNPSRDLWYVYIYSHVDPPQAPLLTATLNVIFLSSNEPIPAEQQGARRTYTLLWIGASLTPTHVERRDTLDRRF